MRADLAGSRLILGITDHVFSLPLPMYGGDLKDHGFCKKRILEARTKSVLHANPAPSLGQAAIFMVSSG